jgi:predicted ATPase
LRDALARTVSGQPRFVVIGGESGVGKTRLLATLRQHAGGPGARVLSGDCLQVSDGELPYAPLVAALRPLVREKDPLLDKLGPAQRLELGRLLPGIDPGPGKRMWKSDASTQTRLFEVLLELLDCLGREAPLVLALEDIHWADRLRTFSGLRQVPVSSTACTAAARGIRST